VILQEERDGRGLARRLRDRYFAKVFADAGGCPLFAARVPVGSPAVVAAATPEALGAFRARWYGRPGAAAVVAAGDVGDAAALAAAARAVVAPAPGDASAAAARGAAAPPPPPAWREVPAGPPGTVAVALSDADLDATTVSLERLEPLASANTAAAVEAEVARAVYASLLDRALDEVARGDDAPFFSAGVSAGPLATKTRCTAITARVAAGGAARGLRAVVAARRAGPALVDDDAAWRRGVACWVRVFERRRDDREAPDALADDAARHFLDGGRQPLAGARAEAALALAALRGPALRGAARALAARLAAPGGGLSVAVLQQPAGADALSDEAWAAAVRAADRDARAAPPSPPRAPAAGDPFAALLRPRARAGWAARPLAAVGATEFALGSGVVVCCRRMDPRASDGGAAVSAQGFAVGGLADLDDGDVAGRAALALLDDALLESRVGAATGAAFRDACRERDVRVNAQTKHARHRGIGGSCGAGGLERLLALLRARFEPGALSVDDGAARRVAARRGRVAADGERFPDPPEAKFADAVRVALYGDLAVHGDLPAAALAAVSGADLRAAHARCLGDFRKWTFVLVGDLPGDEALGGLLEAYLGGDAGAAPGPPWAAGAAPRDLPRRGACAALAGGAARGGGGAAPRPVIRVAREAPADGAAGDASALALVAWASLGSPDAAAQAARQLACDVLQRRLLEFLRTSTALVYSVAVDAATSSLSDVVSAQVAAQTSASNVAAVRDAAIGLVGGFAAGGGDAAAWAGLLADAKTQRVEAHARKLRHRSYWLFYLLDAYKLRAWRAARGEPPGDAVEDAAASHATRYGDVLRAVDAAAVVAAARDLFPRRTRVSAELLPPPSAAGAADDAAAAAPPVAQAA